MTPSRRSQTPSDKGLFVSRSGWYSIRYPSHWTVEDEEDCTTLSDMENGVGALQISAYQTPSHQNPKEVLREYLADNDISYESHSLISQKEDQSDIASYKYTQDRWAKQVWFVSFRKTLLMITYTCKVEDQGVEEGEVEEMIRSVTFNDDVQ